MEPMEIIKLINYILSALFIICYFYQIFYVAIPFLIKLKPHRESRNHRFAILISARNEESVIANLLETIRQQDYPAEYITTFVVADNCTDRTAAIAAANGAIVYERFHKQLVGKGYALNYLLKHIARDYGENAFDAFLVFDADNLLSENYITEMNKTYSDGYEAITSYRNSKNYGDNWISAGYALYFLREAKFLNYSRMALGTSCAVSGTGFLFSNKILKECGGWNFFLLTEDIEFSVYNIVHNRKIGYCPDAVVYDEQPVSFRQSWRQRLRWAKGNIQVYKKHAVSLLKGIFRGDFACFDMTMSIMPAIVLTVAATIANIAIFLLGLSTGQNIMIAIQSAAEALWHSYLLMLAMAALTTLTEWKQIHICAAKKIMYTFTFPLFMATYIPISLCALFARVEWKPIEHKAALKLSDIQNTI